MNNKVLDIYSDDLTDAETESLFSTPKESRKGDRRKIDYKKAKRKAKIDLARSFDGLPMYDNLHQYSKIVLASYAVGKIALVDMLLPSRK